MQGRSNSTARNECLICGSPDPSAGPMVRRIFRVHRCRACRFAWIDRTDLQRPEAAPNYQAYPYNRAIADHFETMKPLYIRGFERRLERARCGTMLSDAAFLDIGCANGEYLFTARETGFGTVHGVEVDQTAADRARVYGHVVEDMADLRPASYDLVQIKNVLTNIVDPVGFARRAVDLIKPGGVLFLDVLNQDSLTALLRNNLIRRFDETGRYGPLRPPYVINGFTVEALKRLFDELSLKPLTIHTSYMGNDIVPYSPSLLPRLLGHAGSLIGRGSMIISEAIKTAEPGAAGESPL